MNRDGSLERKRHTHTRSFFDVPERSVACPFDRPGFFWHLSQFRFVQWRVQATVNPCVSMSACAGQGDSDVHESSLIMSCHCVR